MVTHSGTRAVAIVALVAATLGGLVTHAIGQDDGGDPLPTRVAVLARADNPVDALAASAVAGQLGGIVLLTSRDELSSAAAASLSGAPPELVVLAGGEAALAPAVESDVAALLPDAELRRVAGADRVATAAAIAALKDEFGLGQPVVTGATVVGDAWLDGTLHVSTLAADAATVSGTLHTNALTVDETSVVDGLNADQVDGLDASDLLQREVVERVATCGPTDFRPTTSATGWTAGLKLNGADPSTNVNFRCPLHLPEGARITGMRYRVQDASDTGRVSLLNLRHVTSYAPFPTDAPTDLDAGFPVTSTEEAPGFVEGEVVLDEPITADPRNEVYVMSVGFQTGDAPALISLYHVSVTYEVLDVPIAAP